MKKKVIAVLGGGISGLAFSANSKDKTIIIEKESRCGGHCQTKIEKNFTYLAEPIKGKIISIILILFLFSI